MAHTSLRNAPPQNLTSVKIAEWEMQEEKCLLVACAAGVHPVPSPTRQLSPPAPMVLGRSRPGSVGRCQLFSPSSPPISAFFLPKTYSFNTTERLSALFCFI